MGDQVAMPSSRLDIDERTLAYLREHRPDLDDLPDEQLRKTVTFAFARLDVAMRELVRSVKRMVRR